MSTLNRERVQVREAKAVIHRLKGPTRGPLLVLLTVVCAALIVRACLLRPATTFSGAHFNQGRNAAWLDITWVNEAQPPEAVAALAERLRRRQIRTAFVYVSYLKDHGRFNPTYAHAAEFTRALKAAYPEGDVQAWLGLPLNYPFFLGETGYVNLADPSVRRYVADFSAQIVREGGFDGVHLDPEPVPSGDRDTLRLLEEVRAALGPGPRLSIAAQKVRPFLPDLPVPWIDRHLWRGSYLREVAHRVDQVALMSYDSHPPLAPLYRQFQRFEVIAASQALNGVDTDLFIGIPTAEERTLSHWPEAENMDAGLRGTVDGLNDAEACPGTVTGVAIYPDWQTDGGEWATYEALWLGN